MNTVRLGEILYDDNYSIDNLLNETREHGLSLGELRQMLSQYQQDLNQTSLELFNNNYERFYKLSHIISCLNEPIQQLAGPIVAFRERVAQLCQSHDSYLEQIDNKLASLEATCRNKELAKRLIALIRRRDRIEEQVGKIDWSVRPIDQSNPARQSLNACNRDKDIGFQTRCDLLERVSVELYHLSNEVRAIEPTHDELISIKRALEASLDERQMQMDNWFEGAFLEAVELQDKTLISLAVRTYRQKDALDRIDNVWRRRIVKPYLDLTVTDAQLTSHISRTYNLLLEFIKRNVELIGGTFIVRSFWQELVRALDKLDRVYSLDNLDTFKLHYEETRKLLDEQDHFLANETHDSLRKAQIEQLASNKQRILSKFNLDGYFNQRLSEIAASVESSLSTNPLGEISANPLAQTTDGAPSCFKIKICLQIYVSITKCWSNELYIDTLELSFVQLACRILNRFANWLGKLRLSDFRITGPSSLDKQTNFLAKQDAIMRLLIEDCDRLDGQIRQYFSIEPSTPKPVGRPEASPSNVKQELIQESLKSLSIGLTNVQSLQRLIER